MPRLINYPSISTIQIPTLRDLGLTAHESAFRIGDKASNLVEFNVITIYSNVFFKNNLATSGANNLALSSNS